MTKFLPWTKGKIKHKQNHAIQNGVIYLKGGDINQELNELKLTRKPQIVPINDFFDEPFFETKLVVHIPL